jgi:hypothetical protein
MLTYADVCFREDVFFLLVYLQVLSLLVYLRVFSLLVYLQEGEDVEEERCRRCRRCQHCAALQEAGSKKNNSVIASLRFQRWLLANCPVLWA